MSKKGRILVAMSGGIDSSLAAVMLHEEGYEVVGMTMKTWDYASSGTSGKKETGCCSLDSINDARTIAVELGFPHYILDIRNEFGDAVIDYFTDEYIAGRTPNPCIMCNTHIKWEALLKRADKLDCEWIATGHYAKIREENNRFVISKGIDDTKDQSYVLWGVSQESLSRTILPLGDLTKAEIRQSAKERGFFDLANKPESYEICFIPDNDYRAFLKKRRPEIKDELAGGEFVNTEGKIIGKHDGYPFYTIGQRKGLGVAFGEPVYVVDILKERNRVVLGAPEDLMRNGMIVRNLNLQKYPSLEGKEYETITKIRSNDKGAPARITQEGDMIRAVFHQKVSAVARGQAAVFYENDDVLGGGWIESAFNC
jgi:tRNA-specific 2-thiouridylase